MLGSAVTCLAGTVYYVDASGPKDPGSGTSSDPYRWIADAIDPAVAHDGDTIIIRPGIYMGQKNRDLDPNGLSITICGMDPNDSAIVAKTIIDPNGAGRGFYFDSGEDANCVVAGLTITNACSGEGQSGGGIFCGNNSGPVITNCVISNNSTELYGGAVYCDNSNPQIKGCVISNNRARYGGGLACFNVGSLTITNCTIVKNSVIFSGGGVFCDMNGSAAISNSIIRANELDYPEYEYGPQVCLFGGSSATISYTNIEDGQGGVACNQSTLLWLTGNIESDPCFALFDSGGDAGAWDFHLKSAAGRWAPSIYTGLDPTGDGFINLTDFAAFAGFWLQAGSSIPADLNDSGLVDLADLKLLLDNYLAGYLPADWVNDDVTSPCIDAGDPNSDWSAEPWPNGKRINMGAYGGTPHASKNGNIADFDVSGQVNLIDFMEFSSQWLNEDGGIVNLDSTGPVDLADFAIFAENWLWRKE